jgi:probable F420-dependent oxidoreductase
MKFGVVFTNIGPFATGEGATAIAQGAEQAGFESLWTVEHVVIPHAYQSQYPYSPDGRMPAPEDFDITDPLIWLAFVAAQTSTIRLGTGILIVPQRNPVVLAKEVATLDHMSGGRVELGIGVGWLEEEFDALGVPFADRGPRTDEYVAAMRALWSQEMATHESERASFHDVIMRPQPPNKSVPIVVGGHSKAAARRAGRLGDGFFPGKGSHDEQAALYAVMRETATEHGRDPDAIEITSGGDGVLGEGSLDEVKALEQLGVARIVVPPLAFDPVSIGPALAKFGDDVIAKLG